MTEAEERRLIERTVSITIKKMNATKLSYDKAKIAAKTEDVLRSYPIFRNIVGRAQTADLVQRVERALATVKDDPYYDIIEHFYFEGQSRNAIAEYFGTNPKTISRHRARLVRQIALHIFSDEITNEIINT